jgi:hypothetical protein
VRKVSEHEFDMCACSISERELRIPRFEVKFNWVIQYTFSTGFARVSEVEGIF